MVCFVILHYIVVEETKMCVQSIKEIEGEKKIIIVDNASPNNSINDLHKLYDNDAEIDVIASKKNLGYARGNNLGYKYAVKKYNPDFIVVMNNDMEIKQKDFIEETFKAYDKYKFTILGPDIYSTQKKYHQNPQTRKILSKKELKQTYRKLWIKDTFKFLIYLKWELKRIMGKTNNNNNDNYSKRPYVKEVVENPLLHGSCYIFSKDFTKRHPVICFFDGTFMYMEAEILYYQAIRDKEKMIYYPFLKVDHHEDKSTDAKLSKQVQKSIFSVKCLKGSVKAFIELMDKDGVR